MKLSRNGDVSGKCYSASGVMKQAGATGDQILIVMALLLVHYFIGKQIFFLSLHIAEQLGGRFKMRLLELEFWLTDCIISHFRLY